MGTTTTTTAPAVTWATTTAPRPKAEVPPLRGAAAGQYYAMCTAEGLTAELRNTLYGHSKYALSAATAWCCGIALWANQVAETGQALPACFAGCAVGYHNAAGAFVPVAAGTKRTGGHYVAQAGTVAGKLYALRVVYVLARKPATTRTRKPAPAK